ncbi:MAG: biotin/lipoyl-containing protein [Eubacteriales bacterium]
MDLDAILKLMDRAEKSSFTKVEVRSGETHICLERGAVAHAAVPAVMVGVAQEAQQEDEKDAVRSPISGVFYLAKEPGAEPFVSVGSRVSKGDTLCIIEAMKTMNEIRSPKNGVIAAIVAGDGETIAAGDPLFLLSEGN